MAKKLKSYQNENIAQDNTSRLHCIVKRDAITLPFLFI